MGTFLISLLCAKAHPREDSILMYTCTYKANQTPLRTKYGLRKCNSNTRNDKVCNAMTLLRVAREIYNIKGLDIYLISACAICGFSSATSNSTNNNSRGAQKVLEETVRERRGNASQKWRKIRAIKIFYARYTKNHSHAKHIKSLFDVALQGIIGSSIAIHIYRVQTHHGVCIAHRDCINSFHWRTARQWC